MYRLTVSIPEETVLALNIQPEQLQDESISDDKH
ncbi:hypothetical protein NOS3756_34560 [Nostoc sp. NIES-3756]|nr:hypothetical protein NOS3756_34560 [Nostoc sp. NIES-3756]